MNAANPSILALDPETVRETLAAWGEPAYRAGQVLAWVYRRGARSWEEMSDLSKRLRGRLEETWTLRTLVRERETPSADGSAVKYGYRLPDGRFLEGVLLTERKRKSLCTSTQVGCAVGCGFCASGIGGVERDLAAAEIVEQVLAAQDDLPERRLHHVVYMGMGEPLFNEEQVLAATHTLTADWGVGLPAWRVTLSTSGVVPGIERLADNGPGIQLCVSLHAARDDLRTELVPINRKWPLPKLREACRRYVARTEHPITWEYVLLDGVNDTARDAKDLVRWVRSVGPGKVNVIPYNPVAGLPYRKPSPARSRTFRDRLLTEGIAVTLRKTKGDDVDAACGQLRLETLRRPLDATRGVV